MMACEKLSIWCKGRVRDNRSRIELMRLNDPIEISHGVWASLDRGRFMMLGLNCHKKWKRRIYLIGDDVDATIFLVGAAADALNVEIHLLKPITYEFLKDSRCDSENLIWVKVECIE